MLEKLFSSASEPGRLKRALAMRRNLRDLKRSQKIWVSEFVSQNFAMDNGL
ncbi:MAG: hypothetical protein HW387_1720 [Parachlamydiales bacterium]|nr:hypothetical protein [Parachlamydiales bacterium]